MWFDYIFARRPNGNHLYNYFVVMTDKAIYSTILQLFAHPLLKKNDTDEVFLKKVKFVEIIWNYCIAKEFNLPVYPALNKIYEQQTKKEKKLKRIFDALIKTKMGEFDQYKNFINKVELRTNVTGDTILYVESIKPENFINS